VGYDNITGFLVLPAIGIVLNPILILKDLMSGGYFDDTFASSNLSLGSLAVFELVSLLTTLGVGLLCAVLFFKRRTSLPLIFSALLGFQVLFSIVQYGWLISLDGALTTENNFALFRSALIAGIWIPVFLTSDRVKGTFRERLD
jgi:hypothetical protein